MNEGKEFKNMQWFCQYPLRVSFIAVVFLRKTAVKFGLFYIVSY